MRHIKVYEQWINESKLIVEDSADLEKKIGEFLKKKLEAELIHGHTESSPNSEQAQMAYKMKLLRKEGSGEGAIEKIKADLDKSRDRLRKESLDAATEAMGSAEGLPGEARSAANAVAVLQARTKIAEEMSKTYRTLAGKATKELSPSEGEAYTKKAEEQAQLAAESKKRLEKAVAEYKEMLKSLEGKKTDGGEGKEKEISSLKDLESDSGKAHDELVKFWADLSRVPDDKAKKMLAKGMGSDFRFKSKGDKIEFEDTVSGDKYVWDGKRWEIE